MTFSAMAAGCADNSIPKAQLPELDTSNPLLAEWNTPHQTPPFSEIELSDYEPAFDAAIACSRAEIDAIVGNPSKPTFGNTIVALERHGALLDRISGIFFNLLEADTSDEMQQIALRVQPKLTELSNDISLNPELFARVKSLRETRPRPLERGQETARGYLPELRTQRCRPVRRGQGALPQVFVRVVGRNAPIRPECPGCDQCLLDQHHRSEGRGRTAGLREGGHGRRCQGAR